MKILHYLFGLPPVHKGGVPSYVLDLAHQQQELEQQVFLLMPGKIRNNSCETAITKKSHYKIKCYEIVNSSYIANEYGVIDPDYFMRPAPLEKYVRVLEKNHIEILHLHSMLGIQVELLFAAKKLSIPVIYTTHDYYGLCPKIDLLRFDTQCTGNNWIDCIECCRQAYDLKKLRFRQSTLYYWYCKAPALMNLIHNKKIVNIFDNACSLIKPSSKPPAPITEDELQVKITKFQTLQQYFRSAYQLVDFYHFNSLQSKEIYEAYLGIVCGQVLAIRRTDIIDRRSTFSPGAKLRIGYLGSANVKKGYYFLLKQLDLLYAEGRTDFQLNTYLYNVSKERKYQKNHHPFSDHEREKVYKCMDLLIVPSIWKETFGLVALEALSYGVPIFLSENVGAKELITQYPGIGSTFSTGNNQLLELLRQVYDSRNILLQMNQCICESNITFDFNEHTLDILKMYEYVKGNICIK